MELTATEKNHLKEMKQKFDLLKTDQGFMTAFLNFAADEIIEKAGINERTRQIIIASGLVGSNSLDLYKQLLPTIMSAVEPEVVKEILYQAVSYIGF